MVKLLRKTVSWGNNVKYHVLMRFIIWFVCLFVGWIFLCFLGFCLVLFYVCFRWCFGFCCVENTCFSWYWLHHIKMEALAMEVQPNTGALLEQIPRISGISELCYAAVVEQQSPRWLLPVSGYNWGAALTYFVGVLGYSNSKLKLQRQLQISKMTDPSTWVKSYQIIYVMCPTSLSEWHIQEISLCTTIVSLQSAQNHNLRSSALEDSALTCHLSHFSLECIYI